MTKGRIMMFVIVVVAIVFTTGVLIPLISGKKTMFEKE